MSPDSNSFIPVGMIITVSNLTSISTSQKMKNVHQNSTSGEPVDI